jgi:integrative and conjugative element protein (TIGR02256 family)
VRTRESRLLTTVWIAQDLVDQLVVEAAEMAPRETGGLVLGYRAGDGVDLVITHVVYAGPEAYHDRESFRPDVAHQEAEIDRIFAETQGRSLYLGDWHTHPNRRPEPSGKDERVLRRIAGYRNAGTLRPVMIIVGNESSDAVIAAWLGQRKGLWFTVTEVLLKPFIPPSDETTPGSGAAQE